MNLKGKVEAVSDQGTRYGIKIGEDWYNGFGTCPFLKDDEVDIDYRDLTKKATPESEPVTFHNISKINSVIHPAPTEAERIVSHPPQPETSDDDVDIEVDFLDGIYNKFTAKADADAHVVSDLAKAEMANQVYRYLRFGVPLKR